MRSIARNAVRSPEVDRHRALLARLVVGVLVAGVLVAVPAVPVSAETVEVSDEAGRRAAFADPDVAQIVVTDDIVLCEGELVRPLNDDLVVEGADDGYTISRGPSCGEFRLMNVNGLGTLTIDNLTLTGGAAVDGGAIWAGGGGGVEVTNSVFTGNSADIGGGAIFAGGGVDVVVTDSEFTNNHARHGGAIAASAGGEDVVVVDSEFTGNIAAGSDGGAIVSVDGVEVAGSVFTGNEADQDGGAIRAMRAVSVTDSEFVDNAAGADGGAILASGTVTVTDSEFTGNSADHDGGAVGADGSNGNVEVADSEFSHNFTTVNGNGGAIFATGTATVTESAFSDNSTTVGNGGAVSASAGVDVVGATFARNVAEGFGGAVASIGAVALTNTTVVGNTAAGGGGGGGVLGGGDLVLRHVTMVENEASGEHGANVDMSSSEGEFEVFGSVLAGPVGGPNCVLSGDVTVSSGYGYADDDSCQFGSGTNVENGDDPGLGGLADNGGLTETMVPESTSPLVDAILPRDCDGEVAVDQRGLVRPQGFGCDIGAVEVESDVELPLDVGVTLAGVPGEAEAGEDVTFTAVVEAVEEDLPVEPSGSVTFVADGGVVVGDAVLGSSAVLNVALDVGVHEVVAEYSGDDFFAQAVSGPVTITVTDPPPVSDPPSEPAPVCVAGASAAEAFVCQVYLDLLDRPVEAGALVYWAGLVDGGMSPAQLVSEISGSVEYYGLVVGDVYGRLLGRAPDAAGLAHFVGALEAGVTVEEVLAAVAVSPEYFAVAGGTVEGWLTALYDDLLGRAPDAAGLAFFSVVLQAGVSPVVVAQEVASSGEARARLVAALYDLLLDRPAEPAGLAFWVGMLNAGATQQQLLAAIAGSGEYQSVAQSRHG